MKSDGKYQRTKLTSMRRFQTQNESSHTIGGRLKTGATAPKKITLPPTPWDNEKDDAGNGGRGGNTK